MEGRADSVVSGILSVNGVNKTSSLDLFSGATLNVNDSLLIVSSMTPSTTLATLRGKIIGEETLQWGPGRWRLEWKYITSRQSLWKRRDEPMMPHPCTRLL